MKNLKLFIPSLISMEMESSPTRISKCQLVLKCSQLKAFISDKTSHSNAKQTSAPTTSAGNQRRATRTSVCSIRRCTKMKQSKYIPRSSSILVQHGQNSSMRSSNKQTKTTRARSDTPSFANSVISLELTSLQRRNDTYSRPSQAKKVEMILEK